LYISYLRETVGFPMVTETSLYLWYIANLCFMVVFYWGKICLKVNVVLVFSIVCRLVKSIIFLTQNSTDYVKHKNTNR
jgi:hypothetical protein